MDDKTKLEIRKIPTVLKLKKIFSLGYLPSRGEESYKFVNREANVAVTNIVNCLAHSFFNLTNEQLDDFNLFDADNFRWFYLPEDNDDFAYSRVFDFVRKTGLLIEETSFETKPESRQWKVAVYFKEREINAVTPDFHFLLQEKDGVWSSKEGRFPTVEYHQAPPYVFYSSYGNHSKYNLYSYLMITNPCAVEQQEKSLDCEETIIQ